MADKTLTIYVRMPREKSGYLYKLTTQCCCGNCVMPECAKCKNFNQCNIQQFCEQNLDADNISYDTQDANNRVIILTGYSVKALQQAHKVAVNAIKRCCNKQRKKSK